MMQLYNVKINPNILMAEIDDHYTVRLLHPLLQQSILLQKGVGIPVIKHLTEQFDNLTKIPQNHRLFGKALVIHLQFDYASHPDTYRWLKGEDLVKGIVSGK